MEDKEMVVIEDSDGNKTEVELVTYLVSENHVNTYLVYSKGEKTEVESNINTKEVEAIDHVADQIQIMACVNYFDVGVKIEYLNKFKNEVVKLPENKPDDDFFIYLLFSPGHYDILYP